MIRLSTRPHFSVLTESHQKLPTRGYLIPYAPPRAVKHAASESAAQPDTDLIRWKDENGPIIPAIRMDVRGRTSKNGYVCSRPPSFDLGLLRRDAVEGWARVRSIQQLWFPSLWARADFPFEDYGLAAFQAVKGKRLKSDFTPLRGLDAKLTDQQKLFVAICCLHATWAKAETPKTECARHLVELRLKEHLGVNNFANYAVEAGWGEMGDSQVNRLWEKVLTANRRIEDFKATLNKRRILDCQRFARTHENNPFIFEFLEEMAPE